MGLEADGFGFFNSVGGVDGLSGGIWFDGDCFAGFEEERAW